MSNGGRYRQRGSLRRRLLLSSLLGTVPLLLLGVALIVIGYLDHRDQILEGNQALAEVSAAYVREWLEGNVSTLRTLARSNEVQVGSIEEIQGLVDRQAPQQPDWDNLVITDAAGRMIAGFQRPLVFIGDRPFFQQAQRTGTVAVSDLLTGRVTEREIIAIAYPILRNGVFGGVVVATVTPERIQEVFTRVPARQNLVFGLWGGDRRLIARTGLAEEQVGALYEAPGADQIFSGVPGTVIAPSAVTGRERLIGYAPVELSGWTVTASTLLATALTPVYRSTALFVAVGLLVLALTLGWAIYSANDIGRQISLLAESARAIGEGKLATRVRLRAGGEVEDLANSLNKMAADLEVLDRMKSELLSLVSHELKTPLTSIRASLEILVSGLLEPRDPRYRETLEIADRQARRLQDLIENLLNVARLEAGGVAVTPHPASLRMIINASVQQYADLVRERGLTLTVETPDDIRVLADVPKITLTLNNLLDNAVKFTTAGGITVRAAVEGEQAVVSVIDTGIGISPEEQQRLFQPFGQAGPLLTRPAGGAGLGLVVVKVIVEAHGGRVFLHSDGPGTGSTFGFTLPLAPA